MSDPVSPSSKSFSDTQQNNSSEGGRSNQEALRGLCSVDPSL
jgi:hypothetical protein